MSRYIDADLIIYDHVVARSMDDGHNWNECVACKDQIDDIPTADVREVVRGEWVFNSYDEDAYDVHGNKSWANRYYCSNCNFEHAFIENHTGQYNFCPDCGADMRTNNAPLADDNSIYG